VTWLGGSEDPRPRTKEGAGPRTRPFLFRSGVLTHPAHLTYLTHPV
jgi:hypothetical protein